MNYTETLNKANALMRQLDLDEALDLYHQLLNEYPIDVELLRRIYFLEIRRPNLPGFEKICAHIFSISSKKKEYRSLIGQAFGDYLRLKNKPPELTEEARFNLFLQLEESHFSNQLEYYKEQIKSESANHPNTPLALQVHCEQLIKQKKLIKAREELKYIIAYYAETDSGKWALKVKKWVESEIR